MSSLLHAILQRSDVRRGAELGRVAVPSVPSGFPALDAELPGGGWPASALTEILPRHEGIGELRLLGPALARLAGAGRCLAWIAPPYLPYAPALAAAGIDLARLLIVRTGSAKEALWATEQALRAGVCGAVLAWPGETRYPDLRRLQLAAEASSGLAVLFRAPQAARDASPAPLRLLLGTADGGLAVRIVKRRGTPLAQPVLLQQPVVARPATHFSTHPSDSSHAVDRDSPATAPAGDLRPAHA
ncbi:MAG: translesion DNA synthesis-associated protein ImuA [Betaproteobacteria bacterium]|jgi:cell division inhibitor SulA/protein ImuA|nr:translesion DNA synthesis-associated protein ImuA [Betaproteobacteria bacterium]